MQRNVSFAFRDWKGILFYYYYLGSNALEIFHFILFVKVFCLLDPGS
jgi:hypothetical protein